MSGRRPSVYNKIYDALLLPFKLHNCFFGVLASPLLMNRLDLLTLDGLLVWKRERERLTGITGMMHKVDWK